MEKSKKCTYKNCCKLSNNNDIYCRFHDRKATISRFLSTLYTSMSRRVKGKQTKRPDLYLGKPIMPRDVFLNWARNHPEFLKLYKRWVMCDFDRRLTPTLNRMRSDGGYTLDNVEWMTNSQNCGLSASVVKLKAKKEIYELLGVK